MEGKPEEENFLTFPSLIHCKWSWKIKGKWMPLGLRKQPNNRKTMVIFDEGV